jgi:superfamily II DNA/RNA helicase
MRRQFNSGGQNRRTHYAAGRRGPKAQKEIHAHRFINKAITKADDTPYEPRHRFADFALSAMTKATLEHIGYDAPSPIQDQCIGLALKNLDVIGLANTGTGKTAAFLLPIIEKLGTNRAPMSAIVLAPTRELAQQIDEEFKRFAAGQKLYSALVVGGNNIQRQIQQVQRGPHIVIGTPGRINDLIDRRVLRLSTTTTFVLDEADRMCDMGFVRDIKRIEAELPRQRQTLCFSATMTPDVKTIVEEFMTDPTTISVVKNETNDHIEQDVIRARDKDHKLEILASLLEGDDFEKTIVFGETKYGVQRLADKLTKLGHPAVAIHGNKSQSQRERALKDFKSGRVAVMVATDVAARGLDIPNVSHVINFDAPKQYDDYVHRIGRTGRAGKAGKALTFVQGRNDDPAAPRQQRQPTSVPSEQSSQPYRRRMPPSKIAEERLVRLIDGV